MSKWKKWRLNERTRMLLTLELAIVVPAAALVVWSFYNLRSFERSRAVEAAIQREFSLTLKSADKLMVNQILKKAEQVRSELPCAENPVVETLDKILDRHPEVAHAFIAEPGAGVVLRSQPDRLADPEFRAESAEFAKQLVWIKTEAPMMAKKLRQMEVKDNLPFVFYSHFPMRGGKYEYQVFSVMTVPGWPEGKHVLGGVVFEADYLRKKFFPEMLKTALAGDQSDSDGNPVAMIVRVKKEEAPLAASKDWDGGPAEVERAFEMAFPGLVLGIKFHGTTIEALSQKFLRMNFMILGGLTLVLAFGIWHTYRNVSREMAVAKLKSDFVANVSHELRTPLSLIRLYAETLELGRLTSPDKHQEYYSIIRKESERLTALINNILDFSRIEAGRKEYDFRETNLAELVRNTLDAYRFQIQQHGFDLRENIAVDLPPVCVDREAIARSLLNLINNALKYSQKEKFLGVNLYRANGDVRLEVEDHGIGISRGEQSKIFEKFYRAGDPLVHNTKGSGLGLSLVRHIVQAHGGRVSVESAPGKGSKFTIALPLVPGGAEEFTHTNRRLSRAESRDAEVA